MIPLLAYSRERDVEKNSTKDCVCVCGWWCVCVCVCILNTARKYVSACTTHVLLTACAALVCAHAQREMSLSYYS